MSKEFTSMQESENTLLVVDSLNLAFRYKHRGDTDFAEDYLRTVESLKRSYKAKYVVITCDQGSSKYRKQLHEGYKQGRKDKFEQQTDAEKLDFELFFEAYTAALDHIRANSDYPILRYPGVEADDIAAFITELHTSKRFPNIDHIWLISSDKDWDLLVRENVSRFSYVTRKEITYHNWSNHYEFAPEDYISIKCLTGDAGDSVQGVPGIGPKRAVALVQEYGSTWDIIANIPLAGKYKYIQELNKCKDLLMLNYQLMDLVTHCRDALGSENCQNIESTLNEYLGS